MSHYNAIITFYDRKSLCAVVSSQRRGQAVRELDMTTITHKTCSDCGITKEIAEFYRDRKNHDGLGYYCRACHKIRRDRNYQKNKDQYKERARIFAQKNPDKRRKYGRDHYHRYRDEYIAEHHAMTDEERQREKERLREFRRQAATNPEWHERRRQSARALYRRNPAKNLAKIHKRRALVKSNGGTFTAQEWSELCAKYDHRCLACGRKRRLTIDHVVPVSKGGRNDISNIQPLCFQCNRIKQARIIDYRPQ